MYIDKRNILQLVALLKAHQVKNIVVCPGGRNASIVHTLAQIPDFNCYPITDERSAGFFALGLAQHGGSPSAICCTSGSALLNIYPAVAEAFYQQVPMIVISADRGAAWIGQMDGQTIPQPEVFRSLVKCSVNLPEIQNEEDEWYCNRLINEAILETTHHGKGPVHINVPISEPIYRFGTKELPEVRVITRYQGLSLYENGYQELIQKLNGFQKRMVVVGQMNLIYLFEKKYVKALYKHFVWFSEQLGNQTVPGLPIRNFDTAIYAMPNDKREALRPELLITYGGHIVSSQLKKYLRKYPPKEHWHISTDGKIIDTFGCLTTIIEMNPFEFLERIAFLLENKPTNYPLAWENYCKIVPEPAFAYSEPMIVGQFIKALPTPCSLHLANSSTVRYAQLFSMAPEIEVCCNRGTNGIEGSLSTAIGYAALSDQLNFIIIGDLSFFYDQNALWNSHIRPNVRILLINNEGGELLHNLPGMEKDEQSRAIVSGAHHTSAKAWAETRGFDYFEVKDEEQWKAVLPTITSPEPAEKPILVEAWTNKASDTALLREFYHQIKDLQ